MPRSSLSELSVARYALLRSLRADGTPVDTPIWFALDGETVLFRTKVGPKTRRLTARRDVELTACDYRGRVRPGAETLAGHASVLAGGDAERGNRLLRERYGWQWNIAPLIKLPGVTNVHRDLSLRQKLRRSCDYGVWADSVIVRVDLR